MSTSLNDNGLQGLHLNANEYCQILEHGNVTQVKVLKLQPLMACGKPKVMSFSLPGDISCNAPECKPGGSGGCVTKNFMTIKCHPNAVDLDVCSGQIRQIQIVNSDVREIFYTGVK